MTLSELKTKNGPLSESEYSDIDDIALLADLSPMEYDKVRRDMADKLGIRVSTLDAEVEACRTHTRPHRDAASRFSDPEPWPYPVDGATLLGEIAGQMERYLVTPKGTSALVALWILHTYCLDAFNVSPYLAFVSPTKQCGKSTAMKLLTGLVRCPLAAANASGPAIYRAIDAYKPTLILDEADSFVTSSEELRGILNAGHTRRLAFVLRCSGEDHEPKEFSVWAPKALASIGNLQATIMDRSIVIEMQRKVPTDVVSRLDDGILDSPVFEKLKRQCQRWAEDNFDQLKQCSIDLDPSLNDRTADNWMTMMKIANVARWEGPAISALINLSKRTYDVDDLGVMVLSDIRDLFSLRKVQVLSSEEITKQLNSLEERPWSNLNAGKGLTKSYLARLLRPYHVTPGTVRVGARTPKGYKRKAFLVSWDRYLGPISPPQPATPPQPRNGEASGPILPATREIKVHSEQQLNLFRDA
jgi:putative DNA primase/helicase